MIETLLFMSLFCVGLKISFEEGMILHFVIKHTEVFPKWLRKPLFDCVYCFSSFYGSIIYWTIQGNVSNITDFRLYIYWIILTICCVYINGVLYCGLKQEFKNSK